MIQVLLLQVFHQHPVLWIFHRYSVFLLWVFQLYLPSVTASNVPSDTALSLPSLPSADFHSASVAPLVAAANVPTDTASSPTLISSAACLESAICVCSFKFIYLSGEKRRHCCNHTELIWWIKGQHPVLEQVEVVTATMQSYHVLHSAVTELSDHNTASSLLLTSSISVFLSVSASVAPLVTASNDMSVTASSQRQMIRVLEVRAWVML